MPKLSTILDQVDNGTLLLPEFQRGYVWNRDQVRKLMRSLYKGHPVGGLLIWETEPAASAIRGNWGSNSGAKRLLLDGQQRITSLYGIVRGAPPPFFEGDRNAFTGLRFNVEDEVFEFYSPAKMQGDLRWIDVSKLFRNGPQELLNPIRNDPDLTDRAWDYMDILSKLRSILDRDFHEELITGSALSVDSVVEIFNEVNSGGTKLSKGDLALAKLCAEWAEARKALRGHLAEWQVAGYDFNLEWLLRNVNAIATGRAPFSALDQVSRDDFQAALGTAAQNIGHFLEAARGRLGLDHNRVLMGRYAIPVITLLLQQSAGRFPNARMRDQILYWYVQSALWGRFAGSTETILAQDYEVARASGIDGLIRRLEQWRGGNLVLADHDFGGSTLGARFYPLLYLLTRVGGARDFDSGLALHAEMLGKLTGLQVHHIFPKAYLYKHGYAQNQVNAIANFCFLTQNTNIRIGAKPPQQYLSQVKSAYPGALESQWIPTDPELWEPQNYPEFLSQRRLLLAAAANVFLDDLRYGRRTEAPIVPTATITDDLRERPEVGLLVEELIEAGCARPAMDTEIADPDSGAVIAVAEAYWADGLQPGIGNPVVLELDPEEASMPRLEELGYDVFTTIGALRHYAVRLALLDSSALPEGSSGHGQSAMWVVRAGREARFADEFLGGSYIAVDFDDITVEDVSRMDRYDLHASADTPALRASVSQLVAFADQMRPGDIVIVPRLPRRRDYLIGRVTSDYIYVPMSSVGGHNRRTVTWLGTIERDSLSEECQRSLGGLATIYRPTGADAEIRGRLGSLLPLDVAMSAAAPQIGDHHVG